MAGLAGWLGWARLVAGLAGMDKAGMAGLGWAGLVWAGGMNAGKHIT